MWNLSVKSRWHHSVAFSIATLIGKFCSLEKKKIKKIERSKIRDMLKHLGPAKMELDTFIDLFLWRTRNINYKWSPYFLRDSRPSETRARVITPREKGETRWGERKMRNHRQSPRFWPFTAERFWSVKFVSPSKSIKHIQWHSLSHWAVIALFIGKRRGDIYSK